MKKIILLGLFAALMATDASAAGIVQYQLVGGDGNPLCEVVALDQDRDGTAFGIVTGCGLKDLAGGLYGGVRKVSGSSWTVVWREPELGDPNTQFVTVLDEKNLTFTTFSQTDGTQTYAFLTAGTLEKTKNTVGRAGRSLASIAKAAHRAPETGGVEVHYTFAASDGTAFCDGIALTQSAKVAVGTHTGSSSCTEGEFAGGNYGHVKAIGPGVWIIVMTSAALSGFNLMCVLDENAMTWTIYGQASKGAVAGRETGAFVLLGTGVLLEGDPQGPAAKSAVSAALSK
ncbi:MAG TPA: hypothetical protein VHZ29_11825 [Rhizomicrobium sp.]|jgi:hypothetical protein|nr:hypothetical protein [Rhizomicrobium sp.]